MKKLKASEIRQKYLDFFVEKGHMVEPSAPLVPIDDDTLLWINSGVATLKKYFDGRETPKKPRIVNSQKAIRTNDIENVGFTARHHTFFEMLGNFSIGDYFKQEAIEFAWEFLTSDKWMGMEPDKLYVTIHPEDMEAYNIWHKDIGLEESRIIRIEGNFWDIGEGPSGPNTEIFYDRGEAYGQDDPAEEMYPGGENERYLEVWNLVFSEFNHNKDHSYTPLPNKNIDTGMGLERMASVSQNVRTNYETDLFMPIMNEIEKVSGKQYLVNNEQDVAFKVIADHIRTIAFAISDGALPANEGRGYVLRRLLRRAVRFSQTLGINEPFMYKLVDIVADIMEPYYPNVKEKADFIKRVIKSEEERFHETLEDGLAILNELIKKAKATTNEINGKDAFKLYDTYGFPIELTEEIAVQAGLKVDMTTFESEMQQQRDRARQARQNSQSMQVQSEVLKNITSASTFVGYDTATAQPLLAKIAEQGYIVVNVNY
ncbi:alanine--tRNA ligase, partial [Staphylococcus aureus]